ncbi:MAG TPA: hypothetical protein VFX77_03175 [Rubrobacter sp.]|nr:hypothetical protein [Rubrobacter sp.]
MTKKSKPLNLDEFDALDWDEEDAEGSNLAHILEHDVDDVAVENVLDDDWISVEMLVNTAEFAIVGPDRRWDRMLTLLFDTSRKRGNWLRPVTGWESEPPELLEWERVTEGKWGGRRKGRTEQRRKRR